MSEFQAYPAWRFHKTLPARIVQNAAEADALGEGWVERPDQVDVPPPADPPIVPDVEPVPEPEPEPEPERPKRRHHHHKASS